MKLKSTLSSLFLASFIALSASGQHNHRNCGTMQHLHDMEAQDPGLQQRMQRIERETEQWISQNTTANQRVGVVITIPVVVNVVYNTTAENVSDAQILSQIAILNQDFRKLNADVSLTPSVFAGLTADCEIEFCLAQRDPNGNPTTGIRRQFTSTTSFSTNNAMKFTSQGGLDAWPTSSYMNMWVCDLGSGLLGYAQFPGGTASTDGVVIDYQAFGNTGTAQAPFNKGRTATHEVGHWLNLRHIWGDATCGNDQVTDTPTQQGPNYGCPSFPRVTCSNGPNGDMFMNYMDYTDDACMYMFTPGQKSRMLAVLNGTRASLLTSLGCVPPNTTTCGIPSGLGSNSITTGSANLTWTAVSGANSYNIRYRVTGSTTWTNGTSTTTSLAISGLSAGTSYEFQVQAACGTTLSAYSASASFTTTSTATCGTPTGIASSALTSSSATISWQAVSGATSYRVSYRVNGSTAAFTVVTTSTLSANLTGLTASTTYQYNVQAVCGTVNGTASANLTFTTTAASTCNDPYEANESRNTAKVVPVNTDLFAKIGTSTDKDWFRFSTVSGSTNIRIVLDQLPADYDIRLYNSSGKQLNISQLSGTATETITRNNSKAATYFIQVYGYNGANNNNLCYRLRINTSGTAYRTSSEIAMDNESETAFKGGMEETIRLFPNPVSTQLQVNFQHEAMSSTVRAEIIDMLGKTVKSEIQPLESGFNQLRFDVSDLNNGIYFIRFQEGDRAVVRKFIVKH